MGCLSSKPGDVTSQTASPMQSTSPVKAQGEQRLELTFKVKRANVFTQGVDTTAKHTPKVINKTASQTLSISKYFDIDILQVFG